MAQDAIRPTLVFPEGVAVFTPQPLPQPMPHIMVHLLEAPTVVGQGKVVSPATGLQVNFTHDFRRLAPARLALGQGVYLIPQRLFGGGTRLDMHVGLVLFALLPAEAKPQELEAALEELPEEQRDVFIAHEIEGRSFKQIAEETGLSVNTLLSRKHYAILHLRRRLQAIYKEFTGA